MATQLQLRRGTTAENDVFTGAVGELTMDTDTNGIRIHDGTTVGGCDVPTAATADYVVEWQAPTDLNNYTWYRKYKSGWLEMGGKLTGRSVTFPVAFALPPTLTMGTCSNDAGATNQNTYSTLTTTGFTGWQTGTNAGWHSGATNFNGYWHACGMSAS